MRLRILVDGKEFEVSDAEQIITLINMRQYEFEVLEVKP